MKNCLIAMYFLFVSLASNAQTNSKNAFKLNPMSLLIRTGNVSYERAVSNRHSFQVTGFYSGAGLGDFKYQGYGIVPEFRLYFGHGQKPLNGGYIAPFGRYQNLSIMDKESKNKAGFSTIGGGAVIGYQKVWDGDFVLNFFAGPSFSRSSFDHNSKEDEFELNSGLKGFGLRTGISIGFAF